jgi:putative ABC transport system substrate-binding protein
MMQRRMFIASVASGVLALPLAAKAQDTARIYRVSVLSAGAPSAADVGMARVLASNLRELGYTEGRNLGVDAVFAEGQADRLPGLARELVEHGPDVIVAIGTLATQACKVATNTIPIIFLTNVDPVAADYARAFATIAAARPSALFVAAHSVFLRDRRQIIALAAKNRLPAIYEWPQHVRDGGLMSYGASDTETYRRVAVYVDRILKGVRPSELPIEQPSKLFLMINAATAKSIGITVPQSMRLRADEVIR